MQDSARSLLNEVARSVAQGESAVAALAEHLQVPEKLAIRVAEALEGVFAFARQAPGEGTAIDDETGAIAAAIKLAGPLAQARMQRRLDGLDAAREEAARCPKCEGKAHSVGRVERGWTSTAGRIWLKRRVSHCAPCKRQVAESQRRIGLGDGDFTPRLEEVATLLATTVPHEMAMKLLDKLLGVGVSEYAIQEMVERRGVALQEILTEQATQAAPYDDTGLPRELPASEGKAPDVAYLEMDGVVPMTREELKGKELTPIDKARQTRAKKAKARGGRGRRYRLVGREVKNAVLYSGDDCAQESASRGCLLDKRYVSHLGDWLTFALLVWAALRARGFDRAKLLVVLSDGAEWIRSLVAWLPVKALLILDLFHVKHRIWEVANLLYGEKTPQARRWAETQCDRVEAGQATEVIRALRFLRPSRKQAQEKVAELGGYLSSNLDRMDYPAYRSQGLRVGSGAVESANYHVTGARLKAQGMRWSEAGAREMAALRADLFNDAWEARTRQILDRAAA